MIDDIRRDLMVETLLDALKSERYFRGALLREIIDELSSARALETSTAAAVRLLDDLENGELNEQEFGRAVDALRDGFQRVRFPMTPVRPPTPDDRGAPRPSTSAR